MKNLIAVFALLTASSVFAFGQNAAEKTSVCTNEAAQKISSRGIKIGANINDVLSLFAATDEEKQRIRNSASGENRRNIGFDFFGVTPKQTDKRFDGISAYVFEFLDDKLVSLSVSYDKPKWRDAKQFTGKMAQIFGLPDAENWNAEENGIINIQCGNYALYAQTFDANQSIRSTFGVSDARIRQILEQRRQKLEDEKRERDIKTFKP